MGQIITEASSMDAAKGILNNPHHPYWDSPPNRREVMALISGLGKNDEELSNRSDTIYLVVNLICEKMEITPGEIEAYVAKKSAEVREWKDKLEKSMTQKAEDNA